MIPVTIAKVQGLKLFNTIVVLVDEQKKRAIPFQYWNQSRQSAGGFRPLLRNAVAEPLTIDLIISIIHALDGTIEEMEIDTLQEEIIYARLRLRGQDGEHFVVDTRFNDALSLAVRLNTPISIAEELMERSGICLAEKGENWEQQLEAVVAMAHQAPSAIMNSQPPINTRPHNLDFTWGLAGWQVRRGLLSERMRKQDPFDIEVDPQTLYQGQPSLHIKFREIDLSSPQTLTGSTVELRHEGFLADAYRGKRVRMVTYCKTSEVKGAHFKLHVNESDLSADSELRWKPPHWRRAETLPIEGTGDWQRQEVVMEIPQNAKRITISFSMRGKGSIWFSGMQFTVVDESVPRSHFEISPSPSQPQNIDFQQGLQ